MANNAAYTGCHAKQPARTRRNPSDYRSSITLSPTELRGFEPQTRCLPIRSTHLQDAPQSHISTHYSRRCSEVFRKVIPLPTTTDLRTRLRVVRRTSGPKWGPIGLRRNGAAESESERRVASPGRERRGHATTPILVTDSNAISTPTHVLPL